MPSDAERLTSIQQIYRNQPETLWTNEGHIGFLLRQLDESDIEKGRLAAIITERSRELSECSRQSSWQDRLLRWCRPRLRNQYSGMLDRYIAAGVTDAPINEPPVQSTIYGVGDTLEAAEEDARKKAREAPITDHHFDGGSFGGGDQGQCRLCGKDARLHR